MAKILVVDDDKLLADLVSDSLSGEYHTLECAYNGEDARELLKNYHYDVIVLDWGLPGVTGVELCKEFRFRGGTTPILMLTGKDTIDEKEKGLDSGADDYLTKPFHLKELSARVRALLRRSGSTAPSNTLELAGLMLDPSAHKLTRDGKEIVLHPKEFALLEHLMRHPNQVFRPRLEIRIKRRSGNCTHLRKTTAPENRRGRTTLHAGKHLRRRIQTGRRLTGRCMAAPVQNKRERRNGPKEKRAPKRS